MFSTHASIERRTGEGDLSRFEYLQALVTEFQETQSDSDREQVLANLANFAYDPINYEHLRRLHVPDLFIDMLTEENPTLVEFGAGGIANIACDPQLQQALIDGEAIPHLLRVLESPRVTTVENALTALYFLCSTAKITEIAVPAVRSFCETLARRGAGALRNLATVMLTDVFRVPLR